MESLLTPVSSLVEWEVFLHAIARAACPDPVFRAGLEGVLGKRRVISDTGSTTPAEQLADEDELPMRTFIEEHAEALPQLKANMQDAEITAFLTAFRGLVDEPGWEPVLASISDLRSQRLDIRLAHGCQLKQMIADGSIRHFDIRRTPAMPNIEFHTYFPLEDAREYLRHVGLEGAESFIRPTRTRSNGPTKDESEHADQVAELGIPAANVPTAPGNDSTVKSRPPRKRRNEDELGEIYIAKKLHGMAAAMQRFQLGKKQIGNLCRQYEDLLKQKKQDQQEQRSHSALHGAWSHDGPTRN